MPQSRSTDLAAQNSKALRTFADHPKTIERVSGALGGASWIDPHEFIEGLLIFFKKDPKIAACSPESQLEAIHNCASLKLSPVLQHVAVIPRGGKATILPQWQGYKAIMERSPEVLDVSATLVHQTDEYKLDPLTGQFWHAFDPFGSDRKIETIDDIKGGVCAITWADSSRPVRFHFVTQDTIRKAMGCAESKNVWTKWFAEQALKTVYRNTYARRVVPVDPLVGKQLQAITKQEDDVLGNDPNRIEAPKQIDSRVERMKQGRQPASDGEPDKAAVFDSSFEEIEMKATELVPEEKPPMTEDDHQAEQFENQQKEAF